jgi:hypothetical protein
MDELSFAKAYEILSRENPQLAEMLKKLAEDKVNKEGGDIKKLKVNVNWKLQKFEGDVTPESKPFEVIEGGFNQPTVVKKIG